MKRLLVIVSTLFAIKANAQKVDSIYFNLYTDSLKKGVHNYINVDGLLTTGNFIPLMSDELVFSSSCGKWYGNSILLDTSVKADRVTITAALKNRPQINKSIVIFIKKVNTEVELRSEKEVIEEYKNSRRKSVKG